MGDVCSALVLAQNQHTSCHRGRDNQTIRKLESAFILPAAFADIKYPQKLASISQLKEALAMDEEIRISKAQLTAWAESLIHINHHGTFVQREIAAGHFERASDLAERARKRAWQILNELFEHGAEKKTGYCEPDAKA